MNVRTGSLRTIRSILGTMFGWIVAIFVGIWVIAETPLDIDHFVESIVAGVCGGMATYLIDQSSALHTLSRRMASGQIVFLRAFFYAALILVFTLLITIARALIVRGLGPLELFSDQKFRDFFLGGSFLTLLAILLVASFTISFLREVHRMLGPGLFTKLFLGTYHRPIEEERIFMFLDLNDSTTIGEKLGPLRFADFKNDFFHDIAEPVLETRGEVFQYVGDEVVLTWETNKGIHNANWLQCFFRIREKVQRAKDRYLANYEILPEFKAGCHAGTVVTTEVGDLKRNIVHSGDAVNTAARIEAECRRLGKSFLVSEVLLKQTKLPEDMEIEELGLVQLRGKSEGVHLWSVSSLQGVTGKI